MLPTEFDLWLRMEMMAIRVEVTELTSNSWIIHLTYVSQEDDRQWRVKEDWKASLLKIWMD